MLCVHTICTWIFVYLLPKLHSLYTDLDVAKSIVILFDSEHEYPEIYKTWGWFGNYYMSTPMALVSTPPNLPFCDFVFLSERKLISEHC